MFCSPCKDRSGLHRVWCYLICTVRLMHVCTQNGPVTKISRDCPHPCKSKLQPTQTCFAALARTGKVYKEFGGVRQYLQQRVQKDGSTLKDAPEFDREKIAAFASHLFTEYPPDPRLEYQWKAWGIAFKASWGNCWACCGWQYCLPWAGMAIQ